MGLFSKLPPQFGHTCFKTVSTQSLQKVHSKVQIIASSLWGGRALLQFSQVGLISSIIRKIKSIQIYFTRAKVYFFSMICPILNYSIVMEVNNQ